MAKNKPQSQPERPSGNPIAVVSSDTHVDRQAWADRPDIRGDSMYAFEQICRSAERRGLPLIVAGDLLNQRQNGSLPIGHIRRQMDRLARAKIPFYYVQGQHELQAQPWLSEIHGWPVWLDQATQDSPLLLPGGLRLAGLDWTPASRLPDRLARLPECDVLVMHQLAQEFMGDITMPEFACRNTPHARVLIIGDYHKHVSLRTTGLHGQPVLVLSPGATNMRKIDEPPRKGYFLLYDSGEASSVRLLSRPVLRLPLFGAVSLEGLEGHAESLLAQAAEQAAGLPEHLQRPLLWVHHSSDITHEVYGRVTELARGRAHVFFREVASTDEQEGPSFSLRDVAETASPSLLQNLPSVVVCDEEPDVFRLCQQLLEAEQTGALEETLREWRTRFIA